MRTERFAAARVAGARLASSVPGIGSSSFSPHARQSTLQQRQWRMKAPTCNASFRRSIDCARPGRIASSSRARVWSRTSSATECESYSSSGSSGCAASVAGLR